MAAGALTLSNEGEWKLFLKEIDSSDANNVHTTEILVDIVSCVGDLQLIDFDQLVFLEQI